MARVPFSSLPSSARLWVFAADRPLGSSEHASLNLALDAFLDVWAAHKVPLPAARELRYDQFVLIGVDESSAGASGCSIDALMREMRRLEGQFGITLTDHSPVLFRAAERVVRVSREEFQTLVDRGEVTPETVVFDNTLTSVGALAAGQWETRAAQTWHARAFF